MHPNRNLGICSRSVAARQPSPGLSAVRSVSAVCLIMGASWGNPNPLRFFFKTLKFSVQAPKPITKSQKAGRGEAPPPVLMGLPEGRGRVDPTIRFSGKRLKGTGLPPGVPF